jgi:hypothetical protein
MNDKGLKRKFDTDKYVKIMELDKKGRDDFFILLTQNKLGSYKFENT